MGKKKKTIKKPYRMFAVYRKCNVFTEWSLECVQQKSQANYLMAFKDFKHKGQAEFIGLQRKIIPVNVRLTKRKDINDYW